MSLPRKYLMIKDTKMELAILEAKKAAKRDEIPVGALIQDANGEIVALEGNRTRQLNDPTAHAEILAIRKACNIKNQPYLGNYTIYVTLEPCSMCLAAIFSARIGKLIFGIASPKYGGLQGGFEAFDTHNCYQKPEIYGGFYEKEITSLMKTFFSHKR